MSGIQPMEIPLTIHGYDCGYGGAFRPLAIANIFQEAAALNANLLGFGATDMGSKNQTWMLSRLDLRLDREPREGEKVVARTWPAGFERLFARRDFELLGEDSDQPIARAAYAYLVIDLEARRPLRPQNAIDSALICDRPYALADARFSVEKPETDAAWSETYNVTAMDRHIDHNGHVNNAHLIAWLCDAPPVEQRGAGQLAALRVEFAQEVLKGDTLQAVWTALPSPVGQPRQLCELRRGPDTCARCEVTWR
ncbi:MAG: thioesterase [Spirochaetia bacterium]|nr:thioesterase [Spirochaetia bacterium]